MLLTWILAAISGSAQEYVHPCPDRARPSPIAPLPEVQGLDPARVRLGEFLFHEPRLSSDDSVSCASCHDISSGGDDGRAHSVGVNGATGAVNAPSVLNRGLDIAQFWDGRAATLVDQVDGPLTSPVEMATSWEVVIDKLRDDVEFVELFGAAYPEASPDADALRAAIVEYEHSLLTPGADFDRYLCGDDAALSPEALRGYSIFQTLGCAACHQGRGIGGNMFQKMGVFADYFEGREVPREADLGRFNVTGSEADRHVFKVPSLRNVEHTAPYFHDGSAASLGDAIRVMARFQLGRTLDESEVAALEAFLRSLSGELPQGSRP